MSRCPLRCKVPHVRWFVCQSGRLMMENIFVGFLGASFANTFLDFPADLRDFGDCGNYRHERYLGGGYL